MEFRILGPVEVIGDSGRAVRVPPRECIVLGMLLLHARRVVNIDKLVDSVWGESPPPTARKQILICTSVLRTLLRDAGFEGRLRSSPPGYALEPGSADRFDLEEFNDCTELAQREIRNGRPLVAIAKHRQALALWRGAPLAVAKSRMMEIEVAHLTERMVTVAESHANIRLRLRLHDGLVEDLRSLVAAFPLREPLHALLMEALVQAGRNAEAIKAYQTVAWILKKELGLAPGAELRRIREEILRTQRVGALAASDRL